MHPRLFMFASASPDNIKQWKCPNGEFMQVSFFFRYSLNTLEYYGEIIVETTPIVRFVVSIQANHVHYNFFSVARQ